MQSIRNLAIARALIYRYMHATRHGRRAEIGQGMIGRFNYANTIRFVERVAQFALKSARAMPLLFSFCLFTK